MVDKRNNTPFKGNVLWYVGNFKYMCIFFLCITFIKRFTITKMIYPKQQQRILDNIKNNILQNY